MHIFNIHMCLLVLGIRDILVPDPYVWLMDPTPFFNDFKDVKKIISSIFFPVTYPTGTSSSVLKI
jgi:hypothetical protein